MERTTLWGTLFSSILFGAAFSKVKMKTYLSGLFIYLAFASYSYANYISNNKAENQDWRSPAEYVNKNFYDSDAIVFCASKSAVPFLYYADNKVIMHRHLFAWSKREQKLKAEINTPSGYPHHLYTWKEYKDYNSLLLEKNRIWLVRFFCDDRDVEKFVHSLSMNNFSMIYSKEYKGPTLTLYSKISIQ